MSAPVTWTAAVTDEPPAGVEAGTLLGWGGNGAADVVGDGAVAVARPGGRVEVRAARDGVPRRCADGVSMARQHELEGDVDRAVGDRAVRGSLRVGGRVAPGLALTATGPIRVEGMVDRAEIRAGGELHLEGRASGAELVGGSLTDLRSRLHRPLAGVAGELDALVAMARQVQAAASARAGEVAAAVAIEALVKGRFDGLGDRFEEATVILGRARRSWPDLCGSLAAHVAAARDALVRPRTLGDPLGCLTETAGFLAAAIPAKRQVTPAGVRLPAATRCSIATAGPLRLLAGGAVDCDLDVGGDLTAMGSGGLVRGGEARVGGKMRVRELGGDVRVVFDLDDTRPVDDLLVAGVVAAGVQVTVAGQTLRFDRKRTDVRVGLAGGRPVLAAA